MKEKLVEEWLIRARERGGIDQAFSQWLISQGHDVLWTGHSRTEFGKDIVSIAPDGSFHAYQMKDEDIDLGILRRTRDQLTELVEVPIVHPRVPAGSQHSAHFVTSGLFTEEASLQLRAMNEGWAARGRTTIEPLGRNELITRFVAMSDAFWPEKPSQIRDFFAFYLAEGRGDFDPAKFSELLRQLLPLTDDSENRNGQRLAAVGLLANYVLNAFEREGDHWSLFRGWTIVAAYQAWFGCRTGLPDTKWKPSFALAKAASIQHLNALAAESMTPRAFVPKDMELDDYTRTRNLLMAAAVAASELLNDGQADARNEETDLKLEALVANDRFFIWGEGAVPLLLILQWYAEHRPLNTTLLPMFESVIKKMCERNHKHAEDECFPPPLVSADDVLERLFSADTAKTANRRSAATWSLETILEFLARRHRRGYIEAEWRRISRLDMMSFEPQRSIDTLLWRCDEGRETSLLPNMEQSWAALVEQAEIDRSATLAQPLRDDPAFALLFLVTYPHRVSPALVGFLDRVLTERFPKRTS